MYKFLRKGSKVAMFVTLSLVLALTLFMVSCSDNQQTVNSPQRATVSTLSKSGGGPLALAAQTSPVSLGAASNFAVLGYAGVTNADASVITGDLGVGPGAPSATGFNLLTNTIVYGPGGTVTTGLGIVNGTIYAGGPVADAAHNSAVIAYNYLVAQVPDTIYSGDGYQLDGMTFTPGVYKFAPSANLKVNGTVYLDFQGNSDALFIFQLGSTLVTMSNSNIVALNNPSQTCSGSNVYWAVGSSATIDGDSFIGTVIAYTTITMTNTGNASGATNVSGRMFALGASVTMVNSTIAICGGSAGPGPGPGPKGCWDRVTGGGFIELPSQGKKHQDDAKGTFSVSGGIKNGEFRGLLEYNDHRSNGYKVKGTGVTQYVVLDAVTRHIEGTAKVNGVAGFTYQVEVSDNGEPGRHDTFAIRLYNANGDQIYAASGKLAGGNIQLHECDKKGHDKEGCDKDGHDKDGFDKDGHDKDGHDNDRYNCDTDRRD